MSFSEWSTLMNTAVGVIGIIVGIIGAMSLNEAIKIRNSVKNAENSIINQAQKIIVNNGIDTYAVIKLTKETTKEQLVEVIERLNKVEIQSNVTKNIVEEQPKIFMQKDAPAEARVGDIWFQSIDDN